jgi:hypothetical protein
MASNDASTSQARQEFQYSSTVDGLLKNVYLPALNNVTFHATPLMEMFGDFGGQIDFAANKIIKAFKTQGAGGFGGISEGGDWVTGRNQKGFQGFERIKYLNAYVSLTGPAARTVRNGEGGYVDAISSAMDDTLKQARMQMERIIGGKGNGELTRVTIADIAEAAMTVGEYLPITDVASSSTYDATAHTHTGVAGKGGYSPVQWLQDGMIVDLVADAEFDGTMNTADLIGPFEIDKVDYAAGTFAIKNYSATKNISSLMAAADTWVVVLQDSYGDAESAGDPDGNVDACLEPNGLENLVDDTTAIWGCARATYPRALKSKVVAAAGAELDEELMMGWILDMVNIQQSVPTVCVVDPKSRLKYFSNRKEDRRFDMPVIDTPFGFRSTGVVIDQYTLMLQSLSSLKPGTLYMLNTGAFKFVKATNGFEWVTNGLGGIFQNKEGSDNLYASAINYMNFVCEDPKGQLKVTGLAY